MKIEVTKDWCKNMAQREADAEEITQIKTLKQAVAIAGKLGTTSKMPGKSYGLPAASAKWVPAMCKELGWEVPKSYGCPVGKILAEQKGTTCSSCYAVRDNYTLPNVHQAQLKRLIGVSHPQWVDAMVYMIIKQVKPMMPWFRWHDSGDLLDLTHLYKIVQVCWLTPDVHHWLPTREDKIVKDFLSIDRLPPNLTIRVSATRVDKEKNTKIPGIVTSTVHSKKTNPIGYLCPAPKQGNECKDCRACWDKGVKNVSYKLH